MSVEGRDAGMLSVLLVDDNEDHRWLMRRALAPLKDRIRIRLAEDGPSALAAVEAEVPGIVLLDVKMPGMDGFEVLRRLRMADRTKDVPVFLFTSSDSLADIERASALGANGLVTKPLDPASFGRVLRATLEGYL